MDKFLVSCIVFCSVFLTSCIGPKGEKGEPGLPGEGMNWKIVDIDVLEADWEYGVAAEAENPDEQYNNHYFFKEVEVPALDEFIYLNGNVKCYVIHNYNFDAPKEIAENEYQRELPYTRHYEKCVNEATNQWEFYTETVDYIFGIGRVEFHFRASDFKYEEDKSYKPGNHHFRLVLTW